MSKLFGRVVKVNSGNVALNNTDLDIHFEVSYDDDLDPNISDITIYNLSENTRKALKAKQEITINAGYKEDFGLIFKGKIASSVTVPLGADRETKLKIMDSAKYDAKKELQDKAKRAYKKGITAQAILTDLAGIVGIKIAVIKLPKNIVYKNGYNVGGNVVIEMQKIANECGASCYISQGQVYIRSLKEGDNERFILKADTGLIGSPEYFEEDRKGVVVKGYHIKCLLQFRIRAGSIIQLEAVGVKALLRVKKGTHICNESEFYTEMEALM